MTDTQMSDTDLRLKLAQIDLALAQHDRTRQEIQFEPRRFLVTAVTTAAALLGAGGAVGAALAAIFAGMR